MKRISLRMIALSMAGALVLSLGAGGVGSAFAQTRGLSPGQDHIKGSNQELVTMLKQTDPDTFLGHKDIIITQDQFEKIGAKAVEVVAGIDSEYDKAVAIQQWVTNHISYDYDNSVEDQNAYTAFIKGEGICQAYSNLTKAMLSYLGIPCVLVNGDSTYGGHAWNMAYTQDKGWFFVDSTWGFVYTNIVEFSKSHQPYYCGSILEAEGDYVFTYHNGVAVCDYQGTDTHWDIPDSFRGLPTTALSPKLFNHSGVGKVETISFPATMQNIDNVAYAFKDFASLEEFQVDEGNLSFTSEDGVLYNSDQTQLLVYPAGKTDIAFQVPDTVTSMSECVFMYNPNLEHVLISDKVAVPAKDGLFYDNSVTVYAPDGSDAAVYAQQKGLTWKAPSEFPSPHAHTLTAVPAKASTCTVKGNIDYWYCTECGTYFSDGNGTNEITKAETELPLAEHTEVTVPGKEATCTEAGLTDGTKCSVCGEILVAQKEIPAKGHTDVTIPGKAATCTETGLTDGTKCSVCGEILVAQKEIPAKGHTDVTIPGKAATCTETGLTDGTKCSVCGEILVAQKEIPAKGHNFENGVCSVCGAEDPNYVKPTEPVAPSTEPSTQPTTAPEATTAPQTTGAPDASQAPGTTAPSTDVPPTGDAASVLLWMSVLVLAGSGVLALLAKRKSN